MTADHPAAALLARARALLAGLPSAEAIRLHRELAAFHTREGLRLLDERRARQREAGELADLARTIKRSEKARMR